jgi:hypothetical protein
VHKAGFACPGTFGAHEARLSLAASADVGHAETTPSQALAPRCKRATISTALAPQCLLRRLAPTSLNPRRALVCGVGAPARILNALTVQQLRNCDELQAAIGLGLPGDVEDGGSSFHAHGPCWLMQANKDSDLGSLVLVRG